jgi:hypothetical protein
LSDIRDAFNDLGTPLSGENLTTYLTKLEDRPWAEWGKSRKPMTKHQLSRRLKNYHIVSNTVRLMNHDTPKGYHRRDFEDAFLRYAPGYSGSDPEATPPPINEIPF